jgi:hypothetical protein
MPLERMQGIERALPEFPELKRMVRTFWLDAML